MKTIATGALALFVSMAHAGETNGYFINLESAQKECRPLGMTPAQWISNAYKTAPTATIESVRHHYVDGDDYMVQIKSDDPFVLLAQTTLAACRRVRGEILSGHVNQ